MATTATISNIKEISIVDTIIDKRRALEKGFVSKLNLLKVEGPVKVLAERESVIAGIYAEGESVSTTDNGLDEYELNPNKRVATAIELSNDLMMNSAVNYEKHIADLMSTRIARAIENQMLQSGATNGATDPKKLPRIFSVGNHSTDTANATTPLSSKIAEAAFTNFLTNNGLHDTFWLFDRNSVLSVQDDKGNEYLKYDNLPEGAHATLFGRPVYFTIFGYTVDTTPRAIRAMLVNPKAYTIALKEQPIKQIKGDTTQELRGSSVFLGEVYVDAKLTDSNGRYAISQPIAP